MNNNPFLSKKIKFKRIFKGLSIGLPVAIMIFVIGSYYVNLSEEYLRDKYQTENVLGEEVTFEEKFPKELEAFKKNYEVDELIYSWDDKLEGYYEAYPFISIPRYYHSGEKASISQEWILNGGYLLELYCPEKKLSEVIAGDYYTCTVKYNGVTLSDDVRYYIEWPEYKAKPVRANVSMVVFSPREIADFDNYEYLVLGSYLRGSKDDISFYSLENGKAVRFSFEYKGEAKKTWNVEYPVGVSLYISREGDKRFVTQLHDPSMPGKGIFRIWNFEEKNFILEKTIGDIETSYFE